MPKQRDKKLQRGMDALERRTNVASSRVDAHEHMSLAMPPIEAVVSALAVATSAEAPQLVDTALRIVAHGALGGCLVAVDFLAGFRAIVRELYRFGAAYSCGGADFCCLFRFCRVASWLSMQCNLARCGS